MTIDIDEELIKFFNFRAELARMFEKYGTDKFTGLPSDVLAEYVQINVYNIATLTQASRAVELSKRLDKMVDEIKRGKKK